MSVETKLNTIFIGEKVKFIGNQTKGISKI